ncbi:hypothetical protein APSETT445_004220 [Aspergillus pseudonomiae]
MHAVARSSVATPAQCSDALYAENDELLVTFLIGTSAEHPCGFLLSAAIRMCHELGLGKTEDGSPLSQSDEDFSASLPMEAPTDSKYTIPTSDLSGSFNAFRSCCQLAMIKGQLYKDLYSPAAEDRPLSQIIASVGVLDEKLQEWKRSIPPEYQPDNGGPDRPRSAMSPVFGLLPSGCINSAFMEHNT